jgi:hypothetical protein
VTNMTGLYLRNGIWQVRMRRNGKSIRVSSGSCDVEKARQFRDQLLERVEGRYIDLEWCAIVDRWIEDSNSWVCRAHANMRHKSKARRWPRCLSFYEFVDIVKRSNGRCALTGIPMELGSGTRTRHRPLGLSIDRINSDAGYTAGNVRLVCLVVNIAMRNWGADVLMIVARALVGRELSAGAQKARSGTVCSDIQPQVIELVEREGLEPSTPAL